ncbi:MAG: polysaccharide biosynthesis/export family protein [bacterium]
MRKNKYVFLFLFLITFCFANEEKILQQGDVLKIIIEEYSENPIVSTINSENIIIIPIIGKIKATGITIIELKKQIETSLSTYLKNPKVIISLEEDISCKILILGEISKPGVYPFREQENFLRIIATVGGFTPNANSKKVKIIRGVKGNSQVIKINMEDFLNTGNYSLLPKLEKEDIIIVPPKSSISLWRKTMTFLTDAFIIHTFLKILGVLK